MVYINNKACEDIIKGLNPWYHRIDLGGGLMTSGDRNQALAFALYEDLLGDLDGKSVLDLGANACGLSIEFARRGATVTAIEYSDHYIKQANFVINHLNLNNRIKVHKADIHEMTRFGHFDIVICVGLIYHLRHPQLALDQLSYVAKQHLVISTQTKIGEDLTLTSREKDGRFSATWEPTEKAFLGMIKSAGFDDVRLISTKPHPGESIGNILGNRSYFYGKAFRKIKLPNLTQF
jgi:tRNA (mo5U34)-methyltransferase